MASYRKALALRPNYADAYCNVGNILRDADHLEDAVANYKRAIAIDPNLADAINNLGSALMMLGHLRSAISLFQKAVALKPDYAEAHRNLGLAFLLQGNWKEGWEEFEWRFRCNAKLFVWRTPAIAMWRGENLQGKSIFVYPEQGLSLIHI